MAELRAVGFLKMRDDGVMVHQKWADEEELARYLSSTDVRTNIMCHDIQGLASTLTLEKATEDAKGLVTEIFEVWMLLGNIINKHGKALQRRWSKKTAEQRKKILLATWPGMTEIHRPDIASLARVDMSKGEKVLIQEDDIYFPHINVPDLIKSRTFLVLLDSRTRSTPDMFANADMNTIRVGMRYGTIKPEYLKGYTMHLIGEKTPETYGRITCWKGNPESAHAWVTGIGAHPGEGLMILKIQKRILRFLLDCTERLLQDVALDNIDPVWIPNVTFHGLKDYFSAHEASHLERLLEAPYEVPDQFDFGRLHGYVNAKRGEVEDHLWLLREDPAYFTEALREASEHEFETIFADRRPQTPQTPTVLFWDRAITSLLCSVYRDVMLWNVVWQALQGLEVLRQRYESSLLPGRQLPKEYKQAISHFANLLVEMVKITTMVCERAIMGCRPFHKYFSINEQENVDTRRDATDGLWWLVQQLQMREDLAVIGLPSLLDEIERLITSDTRERNRLSPRLARVVSDFSILAELQRQLGLSSPGGRIASAVSLSELSNTMKTLLAPMKSVMKMMQTIKDVGKYGTDLSSLHYPVDQRRTTETNAQMRSAEAQLDDFWDGVDRHFIQQTGKTSLDQLGDALGRRKLTRTPEWIEPERSPDSTEEQSEAIVASLFLATLEERTERTVTRDRPPPVKEKTKTRAAVGAPPVQPTYLPQKPGQEISTESDPTATVKLRNRDQRSLAMLFRVSSEEGVAGELPWIDFLHVMTSLGFAVQKLDGSASLFFPASGDLDKSIIFHEPHPARKIPFHIARRHGRRLTRTFGWTAESFIRT